MQNYHDSIFLQQNYILKKNTALRVQVYLKYIYFEIVRKLYKLSKQKLFYRICLVSGPFTILGNRT